MLDLVGLEGRKSEFSLERVGESPSGAGERHWGFYCEPLPQITKGELDAGWAAQQLDRYFALPAAASDMTTLDGNTGVADGTTTDLTYTSVDGIGHHAAAYVLDMGGLGLSAAKNDARTKFKTVLNHIRSMITNRAPWTPESIRIVYPPKWVPNYDAKLTWPGRPSPAVESMIARGEGACAILTGSQASAVRTAMGSTSAMSSWSINGRKQRIAIGVVIPGLAGCDVS